MSEINKDIILSYKDLFPFSKYGNYYGAKSAIDKMQSDELKKYEEINNILKNTIEDYISFSGFMESDRIRIQYRWDKSFTGLGYVTLSELVNGFKNDKESDGNEC